MTSRRFSLIAGAGSAAFLAAGLFGQHIRFAPEGAAAGGDAGAGGGDGGAAAAAAAAAGGGGGAAGGDGGAKFDGPWWDNPTYGIDDDTKKWASGKQFADPATAMRSGMQADRVARDRNVLPKPDPTKIGEWAGWKDLGWPEKIDDYKLEKPKIPEGMAYAENVQDLVRQVAHSQKIPLGQAQGLLNGVVEQLVKDQGEADARLADQGRAATEQLDRTLRSEWGTAYDANKELATRAARMFGVGEGDLAKLETVMGSPGLMKMFHQIGDALGEDRITLPAGGGGSSMGTPAGDARRAQADLERMAADPAIMAALNDPRHPQHNDIKEKRFRLMQQVAK